MYIELKLYKCVNDDSCKEWEEVEEAFDGAKVQFNVANAYFDYQDYAEPIKYFLDDQLFWDVMPGIRKKVDVYVREA